jgi:hypothetical protein
MIMNCVQVKICKEKVLVYCKVHFLGAMRETTINLIKVYGVLADIQIRYL